VVDRAESRPAAVDSGPEEDPATLLARIPNLAHALRQAPPEIKRQVFDAFGLQVTYDKTARRIEISATITEAIAEALHNAEDLPKEVSSVAHRDIAGARFVRGGDRGRITETTQLDFPPIAVGAERAAPEEDLPRRRRGRRRLRCQRRRRVDPIQHVQHELIGRQDTGRRKGQVGPHHERQLLAGS
jgi:hypothetical protein